MKTLKAPTVMKKSGTTFSTALMFIACVWLVISNEAAELNWREQFDQGLIQEEVHQDLEKAVEHYQSILTTYDAQRDVLAMSMYRLAETLRKLGRIDEAAPLYERIVREFPDKQSLVLLSQRFVPGNSNNHSENPSSDPSLPPDGKLIHNSATLRILLREIEKVDNESALDILAKETDDDFLKGILFELNRLREEILQFESNPKKVYRPGLKEAQEELLRVEGMKQEHLTKVLKPLKLRLRVQEEVENSMESVLTNAPLRIVDRPETLKLFIEELETSSTDVALQLLTEEAGIEVPLHLLDEKIKIETALTEIKEKHPKFPEYKLRHQNLTERLHSFIKASRQQLSAKLRILETSGNPENQALVTPSLRLVDKPETLKLFIEELEKVPADRAVQMLIPETDGSVLSKLLSERSTLTTELEGMREVHGPEHPRMLEQKAKLESIQKQMNEFVEHSVEQLQVRLRILEQSTKDPKPEVVKVAPNPEEVMLDDLKTKLREQPDLLAHVTIHGQAPIHRAAMNGHLAVIDFLAAQGTDMNVRDRSGKTALHIAVERGNLNVVEHLIQIDGIDLNAMEPFHSTPLHIASVKGFLAIATALVEAGADLNQVTGFNRSHGNPGRNINLGQGLPTIDQVHRGGRNSQLFTTFLTAGNSPLHYSSLLGFTNMSELFIEKGANLNVTNRCGLTPLLFQLAHSIAGPERILETTQLLLNHGADPNVMGVVVEADNFFGRSGLLSPLSQSKESTYFQKYEISSLTVMGMGENLFMESKSAQPKQLWGWTSPLHVGVFLGDDITRLLIKHGADINSQNFVGVTPIQSLMARRSENFLLDELAKLESGQDEVDSIVQRINPGIKDDMGYYAHDYALFVDRYIDSAKGLMSLMTEEQRDQVAYETFWNHFRNMASRPATQKYLSELISEFPQLLTQPGPKDLLPLEQAFDDENLELVEWLQIQGAPTDLTRYLQLMKDDLEAFFTTDAERNSNESHEKKRVVLDLLKTFEQP